jgi:hypothetical protein
MVDEIFDRPETRNGSVLGGVTPWLVNFSQHAKTHLCPIPD